MSDLSAVLAIVRSGVASSGVGSLSVLLPGGSVSGVVIVWPIATGTTNPLRPNGWVESTSTRIDADPVDAAPVDWASRVPVSRV